MKIVLTGQISGTRDGKSWPPPGTDLDLPDQEAEGLIRAGTAIRADHKDADQARSGGEVLADEILAGAPEGRDWTEGQPDTNLSRARFLANADGDSRQIARDAAERAELDDAHTVPGANPDEPVVGDDKPNPTDAPSVLPPAPVESKPADRPKPAGK
jgi:hypothetical protein